ncbi:MAG: hypothetical protein ABSF69_09025 [Polyangiaceae bacterium]|jgi:hypothetical protein
MDPSERARRLVALATHTSTTCEEARTAAMAACRLIVKHKLLDPSAGASDGAARRRPSRGGATSPGPSQARRARHDEDAVSYRAARTGTCAFCATAFQSEDDVITYPSGSVDHWHCAKRRAAGQEPEPRAAR